MARRTVVFPEKHPKNFSAKKYYEENYPDLSEEQPILIMDGLDDAFIGIGFAFGDAHAVYDKENLLEILAGKKNMKPIAVYDRERIIKVLVDRDGMTREDAEEYISFNIEGAYVGKLTPIILEHR
jgi:hypothetical protein